MSGGDDGAGGALELFDEQAYLRDNPDIAEAILRGQQRSGEEHYRVYGAREGRPAPTGRNDPRGRLITIAAPLVRPDPPKIDTRNGFETLIVSRGGGVMLVGWVDDLLDEIDCIRVVGSDWRVTFDGPALARVRRADVEAELGRTAPYAYGFLGLVYGATPIDSAGPCHVEMDFKRRAPLALTMQPRTVEEEELRNIALAYLAAAQHFGNAQLMGIACLDRGLGAQLLAINKDVVAAVVASPYVVRFGSPRGRPKASIVVCLYGKLEYFFLQMGAFSDLPGIEDYEFVYVCNSPELAEALVREARIASTIHDLRVTLVLLPGNAGFGAANNAAAAAASSDRILIVNPDVFPRDLDWARKHTDLVSSAPPDQTRLFGVPLYYDDGSLMHGGMYFEIDSGVAFERHKSLEWRLLRVEHYGKGAPPESNPFTVARPVPAVTGAFISLDRAWFEKLGGFTVDYVFGHYEDADLCLKSLEAGHPTWLHDIRLWHLEGKGSTRLPLHEGGSMLNRWVFTSRWGELISNGLVGPIPERSLAAIAPGMNAEAAASPRATRGLRS